MMMTGIITVKCGEVILLYGIEIVSILLYDDWYIDDDSIDIINANWWYWLRYYCSIKVLKVVW
jgi:hypothetical protein